MSNSKEIAEMIGLDKNHVNDDYTYIRGNLYQISDKNSEAIDILMDLCREMESPRAFEVLSSMIKNQADITDKLMDLQKKRQSLEQESPPSQDQKTITNNNVFVGSTADLQKMLMKDVTPIEQTDE